MKLVVWSLRWRCFVRAIRKFLSQSLEMVRVLLQTNNWQLKNEGISRYDLFRNILGALYLIVWIQTVLSLGVAANQLMTYGPTLSPSCDRHNLFLSRANITEAIIERRRIGIPHRHSISAFHIGKSQQLNEENRSDTHKYINPRLSVGAKTSLGACEAVRTLLLMKSANLYIKISEKWVHLREHEGTEEVESNSTDEAQS